METVFTVETVLVVERIVRRDPQVYSRYPKRLESLTIEDGVTTRQHFLLSYY